MSVLSPFPGGWAQSSAVQEMTALELDHQNKAEAWACPCVCAQTCSPHASVCVCVCVTVQHSLVAGLSVELCINELKLH